MDVVKLEVQWHNWLFSNEYLQKGAKFVKK